MTQELVRNVNFFEGFFWIAIGLCFAESLRRPGLRKAKLIATLNFIAFGFSDFVEYHTGAWWRPWWLLLWKAACVCILVVQFIGYVKRRRYRLKRKSARKQIMPPELTPEEKRVRNTLTQRFHATLDERVARYLEIEHQSITSNSHFAAASAECLSLYMDGQVISTVMMTQAVAEGIRDFVVKRNQIELAEGMKCPEVVRKLQEDKFITPQCAEAFVCIWKSYRNDVHHMWRKVADINFREIAPNNIKHLALIESEIFAVNIVTGGIDPVHRQYWDIKEDGTTETFLRCAP